MSPPPPRPQSPTKAFPPRPPGSQSPSAHYGFHWGRGGGGGQTTWRPSGTRRGAKGVVRPVLSEEGCGVPTFQVRGHVSGKRQPAPQATQKPPSPVCLMADTFCPEGYSVPISNYSVFVVLTGWVTGSPGRRCGQPAWTGRAGSWQNRALPWRAGGWV